MGGKGKKNTFPQLRLCTSQRVPSRCHILKNLTSPMFSVNNMLPSSVSELQAQSSLLLFTPRFEKGVQNRTWQATKTERRLFFSFVVEGK